MDLRETLDKYRSHPEFLGLELTDPNQKGAVDDTVMHIASRKGALEDLQVFFAHGGDVNAVGDLGFTLLHSAAMRGQLAVIRALVDRGADTTLPNEFGQLPIDVARLGDKKDVVAFLEELSRADGSVR